MVPLALSVPGGDPEKGEEVVVAAGLPPGAISEPDGTTAVLDADVAAEVTGAAEASVTMLDQPAAATTSTARATSVLAVRTKAVAAKPAPVAARTTSTTAAPKAKPATTTSTTRAKVTTTTTAKPTRVTAPPTTSMQDAVWDRLAECETGNVNDPNPPYYGYWQISAGTWLSLGETGQPDQHTRSRQLAAAKRLQASRGWGEWPECARQLGLL